MQVYIEGYASAIGIYLDLSLWTFVYVQCRTKAGSCIRDNSNARAMENMLRRIRVE